METVNQISYSFKEKYFSLDKEKRIRSRQFLTRIFVPGILMIIPIFILTVFLYDIIRMIDIKGYTKFLFTSIIIGFVPIFLSYGVSLFFLPTLIKKRCHDFGGSGVIESRLFIIGFILFLLVMLLLIGEILGFIFISEIISFSTLLVTYDYLRYGIIVLGLYLMLRPGTKGNNEYGDDSSNVKIGFLG